MPEPLGWPNSGFYKDAEDRRGLLLFAGSAVILFLIAALIWIFASYQEARAFERVTGKPVTTWDAMWIQLRVQEPATSIEE